MGLRVRSWIPFAARPRSATGCGPSLNLVSSWLSCLPSRAMGISHLAIVTLGALAGGFVSGLAGFGTGITAIAVWLYVVSPPVAASLVVVCSVIAQLQSLPWIWRSIEARRVLPF